MLIVNLFVEEGMILVPRDVDRGGVADKTWVKILLK